MSEQKRSETTSTPEQSGLMDIDFENVIAGETIHITTGEAEEAHRYEFQIKEAGEWPKGMLTEYGPGGSVVGPLPIRLDGCGRWTTPEENPVQNGDPLAGKPHQERAFSFNAWGLRTGLYFAALPLGENNSLDRLVFDRQTITHLSIEHSSDQ